MCGFFITNFKKINKSHLNIIHSLLKFRGPDYSSKLLINGSWKSYHTRLSIIDLTAKSNQPIRLSD